MLSVVFTCAEEKFQEDQNNFDSVEAGVEGPCIITNLVAGQHCVAELVAVDVDAEGYNLIVTYTSNDDWIRGTTHLSIGNRKEDLVPLKGSGNAQIGQFEYTVPFSVEPHEVFYIISSDSLDDHYCFVAHAALEGSDGGETAWAMYKESFL
jgi:hypothetical protein